MTCREFRQGSARSAPSGLREDAAFLQQTGKLPHGARGQPIFLAENNFEVFYGSHSFVYNINGHCAMKIIDTHRRGAFGVNPIAARGDARPGAADVQQAVEVAGVEGAR